MPFLNHKTHPFTKDGIEWLNPGQNGVYGIFNKTEWIYVGKGDIRDRLLRHLGGDNPCILRRYPTHWIAEVVPNMDSREKELIVELNPECNKRVG
mgnify:CR=1 FL=1